MRLRVCRCCQSSYTASTPDESMCLACEVTTFEETTSAVAGSHARWGDILPIAVNCEPDGFYLQG